MKLSRPIIALFLTVIYSTLIASPILSRIAHSGLYPRTLGECSGDCGLCGCSPEKSRNHTCCCARKKAKLAAFKHERRKAGVSSCCGANGHQEGQVLSFTCPCGPQGAEALAEAENPEVVPTFFSGLSINAFVLFLPGTQPGNSPTRHAEPPDPPPKSAVRA